MTGTLASAVCGVKEGDRHGVDLILHGHAHHGSYSGRTATGIPVYNVCAAVLKTPYALLELGA